MIKGRSWYFIFVLPESSFSESLFIFLYSSRLTLTLRLANIYISDIGIFYFWSNRMIRLLFLFLLFRYIVAFIGDSTCDTDPNLPFPMMFRGSPNVWVYLFLSRGFGSIKVSPKTRNFCIRKCFLFKGSDA